MSAAKCSPSTVSAPDANLGFAPMQWVEKISDDSDDSAQAPNEPGQLRLIQTVDYQQTGLR